MKKKITIPTIIGVFVLLIAIFVGVFFLKSTQVFRIGASGEAVPKDIRVSNLTDTSATISWTTDKETSGFVSWGASEGSLTKVAQEDVENKKFFNHHVSISGLAANTNYFYKINSEGVDFDNNGIPYKFTTGATLGISKESILLSGSVISASGKPEEKALVYANVGGYLLSTLTSSAGNFVFQLSGVRTQNLGAYTKISLDGTLVQLSIVAPPDGVASAQIYPKSGNPVPTIVIGKVYDFRTSPANYQGESPDASLSLPENATQESKFNVEETTVASKTTSVILESIDEGETITSQRPQFFGKGPGGEELTITVHSENPVTATVEVPNNGSWSYTVPDNLAPGEHTIKISWIDASGITRFLTRNFVVKAGDAPSFSASSSGTITASPSATPKSTIKPTATATSSAMPVPVTGDLTPTLILSIMGLAVIAFSFFIWRFAEN